MILDKMYIPHLGKFHPTYCILSLVPSLNYITCMSPEVISAFNPHKRSKTIGKLRIWLWGTQIHLICEFSTLYNNPYQNICGEGPGFILCFIYIDIYFGYGFGIYIYFVYFVFYIYISQSVDLNIHLSKYIFK